MDITATHTKAAESALREDDPDEGNWPTGDQVAAIIGAVLKTGTHIIVTGNLVDGFTFVGPVTPNDPAVDEYIDTALHGQEWHYVSIQPLEEAVTIANSREYTADRDTVVDLGLKGEKGADRLKVGDVFKDFGDSDDEWKRVVADDTGEGDTVVIRVVDAPIQTWTFFGHWEDDRIIVEWFEPGTVEDDRDDDGEHEQGLWAASASGPDSITAQAAAVAEYEEADE